MTRAGYESAPYAVLEKDKRIELRQYPILRVAETSRGGDDFMRLFRYISKGNTSGQKIAMTTPVYMTETPGTGDAPRRVMAFVMPRDMTAEAVPAPSDPAVRTRETAPGRFAVLRFRGGRSAEREAEVLGRLRDLRGTLGRRLQLVDQRAARDGRGWGCHPASMAK